MRRNDWFVELEDDEALDYLVTLVTFCPLALVYAPHLATNETHGETYYLFTVMDHGGRNRAHCFRGRDIFC